MRLSQQSLSWSLSHIKLHGETDILPESPESVFLLNDREHFSKLLSNLDVTSYRFSTPHKVPTPKASLGFRITSQPDFVDNILLTALIYGNCRQIEKARIPKSRYIACSYRINPTASGSLFHKNHGYKDFINKCAQNCLKASVNYVLKVDISDFYNQISHHRIRNNLEIASIQKTESTLIEDILFSFCSRHHSQGIPVGPSFSIVLSEASLIDVDSFLLNKGISFSRYVDDFVIFCRSYKHAIENLHHLSSYLYACHRLSLASSKTYIQDADKFLSFDIQDPEELEKEELAEQINDLIFDKWNPYEGDIDDVELTDKEKNAALRKALRSLFNKLQRQEPIPFGLSRFILRKSTLLRSNIILRPLCTNIDRFLPVFKDVFLYLRRHLARKNPHAIAAVKYLMKDSSYANSTFVQLWILHVLSKYKLVSPKKALTYCSKCDDFLRDRYLPLIAMKYGKWDIVRELKEEISNFSIPAQRSIILSTQALGEDERKHWLNSFNYNDDIVSNRLCKLL